MMKKKYSIKILLMCSALCTVINITSCGLIAFAPHTRTEQQLKPGDSVVLVSLAARRLHLMDMAYIAEDTYKYTQQMLPAFKSRLKQAGLIFSSGTSHLDTTGDMLYEALRLLRRKNSDTLLITLLKNNLPPYNAPVVLFMCAATPPNPYRSAGGFYGDSYTTEKDKGNMQIRSFVVVYKDDKIVYFDAIKSGGRYKAITRKKKKAVKISDLLAKKLIKTS